MSDTLDAPIPATVPVREALQAYLEENGFTTESYDEPKVTVTFWGMDFTVPNPPSRQLAVRFHDLHHIMTGYGTDPAGCLLYTSPSPRDGLLSRMPSSA